MDFLQAGTQVSEVIDHTIPLWGLITALVVCVIFIVNMHIKLSHLDRSVQNSEKRLDDGDKELKAMNGKINEMSALLVKINTKLDIYFKMHETP